MFPGKYARDLEKAAHALNSKLKLIPHEHRAPKGVQNSGTLASYKHHTPPE